MGAAAETAFFKHIFARYYQTGVSFTYWRGRKSLEVDILAEVQLRLVALEGVSKVSGPRSPGRGAGIKPGASAPGWATPTRSPGGA
ncbi:MAG: DUF4143 domain-containing protein [Thermoanaerobaculia bacterium]